MAHLRPAPVQKRQRGNCHSIATIRGYLVTLRKQGQPFLAAP